MAHMSRRSRQLFIDNNIMIIVMLNGVIFAHIVAALAPVRLTDPAHALLIITVYGFYVMTQHRRMFALHLAPQKFGLLFSPWNNDEVGMSPSTMNAYRLKTLEFAFMYWSAVPLVLSSLAWTMT